MRRRSLSSQTSEGSSATDGRDPNPLSQPPGSGFELSNSGQNSITIQPASNSASVNEEGLSNLPDADVPSSSLSQLSDELTVNFRQNQRVLKAILSALSLKKSFVAIEESIMGIFLVISFTCTALYTITGPWSKILSFLKLVEFFLLISSIFRGICTAHNEKTIKDLMGKCKELYEKQKSPKLQNPEPPQNGAGSSGYHPTDNGAGPSRQQSTDKGAGPSGQQSTDKGAGPSGQQPTDKGAGPSGQPTNKGAGPSGQQPTNKEHIL